MLDLFNIKPTNCPFKLEILVNSYSQNINHRMFDNNGPYSSEDMSPITFEIQLF